MIVESSVALRGLIGRVVFSEPSVAAWWLGTSSRWMDLQGTTCCVASAGSSTASRSLRADKRAAIRDPDAGADSNRRADPAADTRRGGHHRTGRTPTRVVPAGA